MFQYDGPLVTFLMRLGDMIILHVIWLICCIPIITIGPATVAANYVALKLVRDEGTSVVTMFFKAFRRNFRQGVVLGLISMAAGGLLVLDIYLCINRMEGGNLFKLVLLAALIFLTLMYLITMLWVWAVTARFENTVPRLLANSLLLAVGNWGATSTMVLQDIVLGIAAFLSVMFLPQAAVIFAIFGLPLFMVINARQLRRVLDACAEQQREKEGGASHE